MKLPGVAALLLLALAAAGCVTQPMQQATSAMAPDPAPAATNRPATASGASGGAAGGLASIGSLGIAGAYPRPALEAWRNIGDSDDGIEGALAPALFTYVLVGDVGVAGYTGPNHEFVRAHENLRALVAVVRSLRTDRSIAATVNRRDLNLYLVPATAPRPGVPDNQRPYDFDAAAKHRVTAQALVERNLQLRAALSRDGPFLVASRAPLGRNLRDRIRSPVAPVPIVVMDLSGVDPRSIPTYVAAYNQAMRNDDVVGDRTLQLLRPAIVSALLQLNAAIPFIGSAYGNVAGMATGTGAK